MRVLTIAVTLIGFIVVIETLMLLGLLRAYRQSTVAQEAELQVKPAAGHVITSDGAPEPLARALSEMLASRRLLVLLTSQCNACDQALNAMAGRSSMPLPTTLILEAAGERADVKVQALAELPEEINVVVTQTRLDTIAGLGPPDGFPVFIVTSGGVVVHSTFAPLEALSFAERVAQINA